MTENPDRSGCGGKATAIRRARVVRNEPLTPTAYAIDLDANAIARAARPGQFVMLRLGEGAAPTLARPFAVYDAPEGEGGARLVRILYRRVGRGTELMTRLVPGDEVGLWGPLGRPFDLGGGADEWVLVAGGIGAASFGLAVRALAANRDASRIVYLNGARSARELVSFAPFDLAGVETFEATDNGSAGLRGNAIDLVERHLGAKPAAKRRRFLASGPRMMLARFADLAREWDLDAQITTEELMACGVGACQGCVTKLRDASAPDGFRYVRVCTEGPVFRAEDLIFDRFGYLR